MKRPSGEVNGSNRSISSRVRIVVASALLLAGLACGGSESRAERLWHRALGEVDKGDVPHAIELLQKIIDDYPDTPIADKARDQIIVYRGLVTAVQSYPIRRARELMVQIARAVEKVKIASGRPPATLAEAFASSSGAVPADPWGRPFDYTPVGNGYRLRCNGADGAPGGEADAADLLIVNGEFVAAK